MDFAFAAIAFAGTPKQQSDSSANSRELVRSSNNAPNMERPTPRRAASSVYSQSVNLETESTYWSAEAPPAMPSAQERHTSPAQPSLVAPRTVHPGTNLTSGGEFREEHTQINDMIRDLTSGDDEDNVSDESADVQGPMVSIAKTANQGHRDFSDRSLKSLVTTKATIELLEAIVRVAWEGDLQTKLCHVAILIHRDLRACFHRNPVTYETSTRATHIVAEINPTVEFWMSQMRALQKAIDRIDVRRDTPNLVEIHKDDHGVAIKKFKHMLSPIPTELGAECNAKIAGLVRKLFESEVRAPFELAIHGSNVKPSPAEMTIMSYHTTLGKQFAKVQKTADRLHASTVVRWAHWTQMSEEIARQATLMHSHSPNAVARRAKNAVARVFHHSMHRSQTRKARRTASGRVEISQPISRPEPREGAVRETAMNIPTHPLDAFREEQLGHDEWAFIRAQVGSSPSSPRNRTHPPDSPGNRVLRRVGSLHHANRRIDYGSSTYNSPDEYDAESGSNPFRHLDSRADRQVQEVLEYYHHHPDAPSLSNNNLHSRSDLFARTEYTAHSSADIDHRPPSPMIEGAPYYNLLTETYQLADPHQPPGAEEHPEENTLWWRGQALRRLEGGPPVALLGDDKVLQAAMPGMQAVQRGYDVNKKLQVKRKEQEKAELDTLRQEEKQLRKELREVQKLRAERERAENLKKQGGGGVSAAEPSHRDEVPDFVPAAAQGPVKRVLKKSASVAGSAGFSVHHQKLRKSESVGGSRFGSRFRSSSVRQPGRANVVVTLSSSSYGPLYSSTANNEPVRSSEQAQPQYELKEKYSGIFRDPEGYFIEGNRRSGYRYVEHLVHYDEEEQRQNQLRRVSSGIFRDHEGRLIEGNMREGYRYIESLDADRYDRPGNSAAGDATDPGQEGYRSIESLDADTYDRGNDIAAGDAAAGHGQEALGNYWFSHHESMDPLCQPRDPYSKQEEHDLFGHDSDPEIYSEDEEEPWQRY